MTKLPIEQWTTEHHIRQAEIWLQMGQQAAVEGTKNVAMWDLAIAQVHATLAVAKK